MRVQTERTKIIQDHATDGFEMRWKIIEVYIQTFENNSKKSVRIYRVHVDPAGIVDRAEMVGAEGKVGP